MGLTHRILIYFICFNKGRLLAGLLAQAGFFKVVDGPGKIMETNLKSYQSIQMHIIIHSSAPGKQSFKY